MNIQYIHWSIEDENAFMCTCPHCEELLEDSLMNREVRKLNHGGQVPYTCHYCECTIHLMSK